MGIAISHRVQNEPPAPGLKLRPLLALFGVLWVALLVGGIADAQV